MRSGRAALLFSIAVAAGHCAGHAETDVCSPSEVYRFANDLFERGDYYRAISEYKRFIFFSDSSDSIGEARYRIGLCYFSAGRWDDAIEVFGELEEERAESPVAVKSKRKRAESYYGKGDYQTAIEEFRALLKLLPSEEESGEALFMVGLCHMREGSWEEAASAFEQAGLQTKEDSLGARYARLVRLAEEGEHLPHRSVGLAVVLSGLLPGSGQAYCGRYADALGAFLINGVMIWAVANRIEKGSYDLALAYGNVALVFYFGNLYGAILAAHHFNSEVEDLHQRRIDDESGISLGLSCSRKGVYLALRKEF